jgi:hypothetical protein
MRRWAGLEPRVGDRVELRVVDASLATAFYAGIPAARLMARAKVALDADPRGSPWDERMVALLGAGSRDFERVRRAAARHFRAATSEGPLPAADDATLALLALAVASDVGDPGRDASLAEIAPLPIDDARRVPGIARACAAYDDRLGGAAELRAPAFEACLRLATRASLGPLAWERLRAIATQLERAEIGVSLLATARSSIFPPGMEDTVSPGDRRMTAIDRAPLDALVGIDPRYLAQAVWRTEQAPGAANVRLATFLADLTRLLVHPGPLVAALTPRETPAETARESDDRETADSLAASGASWMSTEWTPSTASAMAEALERGATTFARVRAAAARGGEPALDAMGAEILRANGHAFANAAFAEILAKSARPRDVVRLVTYFAIAPDPGTAAHALGACGASELPRVLGAWLEAMLPQDGDDAPESTAARVSACIASLRPYPHLYRAVERLLPRIAPAS